MYDWLVVGAGLSGAVFAERAASLGKKVLLIDQRPEAGGNIVDERRPNGQLLHRYGPHLFHTNSADVFAYLSRFTEWNPYFHRVRGYVDGQIVPLPFNFTSIEMLFPAAFAQRIITALIDSYGFGRNVPILKLRESQDATLKLIGDFVYDTVFRNYTQKQWDLLPEQLLPAVTARVPIALSRNPNYFGDRYQAMPRHGYSAMMARIIDHSNIEVRTNAPFDPATDPKLAERVFFTGPLDELTHYDKGVLPYRSTRFEFRLERTSTQESATLNYPNNFDFTRITDHAFFSPSNDGSTWLLTEYPIAFQQGASERFYPVPTEANNKLYEQIHAEARRRYPTFVFSGRLADYQYYNMDQAVARSLSLAQKLLA